MSAPIEPENTNAAEIAAFFGSLPSSLRLRGPQQFWPRFVYHFTDVLNVPSILNRGALECRQRLPAGGFVDTSSHGITERTPYAHPYVRLYFRPVTPMQYGCEGFKPQARVTENRHWPFPVFFLFDAARLCGQANVEFTSGNFADSRAVRGAGINFLRALPWETIYGMGTYPTAIADQCRLHRQAEVLIPDQLPFDTLRAIVCRSGAERDTLLDLLSPPTAARYEDRIRVTDPRETLFTNRHAFVKSVIWSAAGIHLQLNPCGGPYSCAYKITGGRPSRELQANSKTLRELPSKLRIEFTSSTFNSVHLRFDIDGHVAFSGTVSKPSLVGHAVTR
jgi:hypothetical protein